MPQYKATLDDGRVVTLEGDHEPTEQDVLSALGGESQPAAPPSNLITAESAGRMMDSRRAMDEQRDLGRQYMGAGTEFTAALAGDVAAQAPGRTESKSPVEAFMRASAIPGELLKQGLHKFQENVAEPLGRDIARPFFEAARLPVPQPGESLIFEGKPGLENEKGFSAALARNAIGFTTPGSALMMGAAAPVRAAEAVGLGAIPRGVGAYFATSIGASIPESIQRYAEAKTPEEKRDAATEGLINLGMAGLIGKHALSAHEAQLNYARYQREQAAVRESPTLTPEQRENIAETAGNMEAPDIEFVEPKKGERASGRFMRYNPGTGKIEVRTGETRKYLGGAESPEHAQEMLEAVLGEETNHSKMPRGMLEAFWKRLTPLEKRLFIRGYTGYWSVAELEKQTGKGLTDAQLGYEASNWFMRRLARMPLREAVEAAGRERWTVNTIDALTGLAFKVREALGTKAAKGQRAIINRAMANLEGVKAAASGETPFAMQKRGPADPRQKELFLPPMQKPKAEAGGVGPETSEFWQRPATVRRPKSWYQEEMERRGIKPNRMLGDVDVEQMGDLLAQDPMIKRIAQVDPELAQQALKGNITAQEMRDALKKADELESSGETFGDTGAPAEATPEEGKAGFAAMRQAAEGPAAFNKVKPTDEDLNRVWRDVGGWLRELQQMHDRGDFEPEIREKAIFASKRMDEAMDALQKAIAVSADDQASAKKYADATLRLADSQRRLQRWFANRGLGGAGEQQAFPAAMHKKTQQLTDRQWRELKALREGLKTGATLPAAEGHAKMLAELHEPVTPYKVDQLSAQYFQTAEKPYFDDFKGKFQAKFGPAPEAAVRSVYQEKALQQLVGAPGQRLSSLVKELGLTQRFQGRGVQPGERVAGKIADPLEELPASTQIKFAFEPGESVAGSAKRLEKAVDRAQDAIKLEYEYRLANLRARQLRRELNELGVSDVTQRGEPLDANKGRMRESPREVVAKANELASVRRRMDEILDPDADYRELLLKLKEETSRRKPKEGEGMMPTPAFQPKPPPKTKTFTKAMQRRYHVIATIYDHLVRESEVGKKSASRETVTPDDMGSQLKAKQPVFHPINAKEVKRPSELGEQLTEDARTSGEKMSLTHRLVVLVSKASGRVEMVDVYYDPKRESAVVRSPTGVEAHETLESVMLTHRPVYSVYLDEPVVNFRQRFESLSQFERQFGQEARNRVAAAGGEWNVPGDFGDVPVSRPGGTGVMLTRSSESSTGPNALEQATQGRLFPEQAGAVLDHISDELGEFRQPEDVLTAIESLEFLAAQGPMPRHKFAVVGGLHKMLESTQARHPDLTADEAMAKMADELYEAHAQSTSYDDFTRRAVGRFGGQVERPVPEGETAVPSPTARELTSPTPTRPIPRTGGPPLRGITGQATRIAQAEAAASQRASTEALIQSQRAAPAEEHPSVRAFLQTGRMAAEAESEAKAELEREGPAAFDKGKAYAQDLMSQTKDQFVRYAKGSDTRKDIYRLTDGAERAAEAYTMAAEAQIRLQSKRPKGRVEKEAQKNILASARTLIASGMKDEKGRWFARQNVAGEKLNQAKIGEMKAGKLIATATKNGDGKMLRIGRQWKEGAQQLQAEAQWALDHWKNPELWATARQFNQEMADELKAEQAAGLNPHEVENYFPNVFKGELYSDDSVSFKGASVMGAGHWLPKTFKDAYEAIASGPYIPASADVAAIAAHRIRSGQYGIARRIALENFKHLMDPQSKKPVAEEPVGVPVRKLEKVKVKELNPDWGQKPGAPKYLVTEKEEWVSHMEWSPSKGDRTLVYFDKDQKSRPLSVLKAFAPAIEAAAGITSVSRVPKMMLFDLPVGAAYLALSGILKHGAVLPLDVFHPNRLFEYAAAGGGNRWYNSRMRAAGGYSALNYRFESLEEAVKQGYITQAAADWAKGDIEVTGPSGRKMNLSRHAIIQEAVRQGLNATRIGDALYRHILQQVPVVGPAWHALTHPLNKWTFDKIVPGLMAERFVENFERLNHERPDVPLDKLVRDVIFDTNATYGNLMRQGVLKDPTLRDLLQIPLLSPLWYEGLLQKELRFYARAPGMAEMAGRKMLAGAGLPVDTTKTFVQKFTGRQGLPPGGSIGHMMGRGLAAYFLLTQVANLVTRGHFTWDNEEEGHKMDAWIPIPGSKKGLWISPGSVFAEVMHDVLRLYETKAGAWDVVAQIGANRLGPVGRMAAVVFSGKTSSGQKIVGDGTKLGQLTAVAREALLEGLPTPISLTTPVQAAAHAVLPGTFPPTKPGALAQRMAGLGGVRAQISEGDLEQLKRVADRFVSENHLKKETGAVMASTDQASYGKLRGAIRNEDARAAKKAYAGLLQTHSREDVWKAMKKWSHYPVTGSNSNEDAFLQSLDARGLGLYNRAFLEKQELFNSFEDFLLHQP